MAGSRGGGIFWYGRAKILCHGIRLSLPTWGSVIGVDFGMCLSRLDCHLVCFSSSCTPYRSLLNLYTTSKTSDRKLSFEAEKCCRAFRVNDTRSTWPSCVELKRGNQRTDYNYFSQLELGFPTTKIIPNHSLLLRSTFLQKKNSTVSIWPFSPASTNPLFPPSTLPSTSPTSTPPPNQRPQTLHSSLRSTNLHHSNPPPLRSSPRHHPNRLRTPSFNRPSRKSKTAQVRRTAPTRAVVRTAAPRE